VSNRAIGTRLGCDVCVVRGGLQGYMAMVSSAVKQKVFKFENDCAQKLQH
jgi:hypothetical protein